MFFSSSGGDDGKTISIAIDDIDYDPNQPRRYFDPDALQSLANSLEAIGLLQPIVVTKSGDRYRLVAGERRVRAARAIGWHFIDALILDSSVSSKLAQLAENTHHCALLPIEVLRAIESLVESGLSNREIAQVTGIDSRWVKRYKEIGRDPSAVEALEQGESLRSVLKKKKIERYGESDSEIEEGHANNTTPRVGESGGISSEVVVPTPIAEITDDQTTDSHGGGRYWEPNEFMVGNSQLTKQTSEATTSTYSESGTATHNESGNIWIERSNTINSIDEDKKIKEEVELCVVKLISLIDRLDKNTRLQVVEEVINRLQKKLDLYI